MKYFFTLVTLPTLLIMLSCTKEEQQPAATGTISGTLTTKNAPTVPVEGIVIGLYDLAGITADTISFQKIDSTVSDARGNYIFSNVPYGKYAIIPKENSDYRFEPANPADTGIIVIGDEKQDYTIDILLIEPANQEHGLCIVFTITQPYYIDTVAYASQVKINRRKWILGFPFWPSEYYRELTIPPHETQFVEYQYGHFGFGYTLTNEFHVSFEIGYGTIFETDINWTIWFAPQVAYFNVEMENRTCTWTRDGTWEELFGKNGTKDHPSVIVRQANPKD